MVPKVNVAPNDLDSIIKSLNLNDEQGLIDAINVTKRKFTILLPTASII